MTDAQLRVVVATPLPPELCELVRRREPRLDLVVEQDLLPPERWPADFSGDPEWRRTPAQQERFDALVDAADVLYGIPDVSPSALARTVRANPRLRWVHVMAAGGGGQVKAAGLTAAELERVRFTTSAGVHAGPLAEFAVFGLLAGAKHLPRLQAQQRDRSWTGRWPMGQVSEQTVLVLGMGSIGREAARKAIALGARVLGVARSEVDLPGLAGLVRPEDVARVIGEVDAIVVTLPGTEATEKMLSADLLSKVKPSVVIVSVGRGTVIDEEALTAALEDGRVGFAALDVFAVEPLPPESRLWSLPNVLISPHTAANSEHEERLIAELFADNARRFLDGEALKNTVNTVEFY